MNPERIALDPKAAFCANQSVAAAHCDLMASPPFKLAAATALLAYQYRLGGGDPQILAIAMSKLNGAREFLRELMNLGIPEQPSQPMGDAGTLRPPEESLDRPYAPTPE